MLGNWICAARSIIVGGWAFKDAFPYTDVQGRPLAVARAGKTDSLQGLEIQGTNNSYIMHSEISIYIIHEIMQASAQDVEL